MISRFHLDFQRPLLNPRRIAQRIEITFWKFLIRLMQSRRSWLALPVLGLMSLCLVAGMFGLASFLWAGRSTAQNEPSPVQAAAVVAPASAPLSGQRNILIVGVDHLDSETSRLESIWLALYIPSTPHITLLPLYPSLSVNPGEPSLADLFSIREDGKLSPTFLAALQEKELWWDRTLILDQAGLDQLNKLTARSSSAQAAHKARGAPADSGPVLVSQANILRNLCQSAGRTPFSNNPARLFELLRPHMYTDLTSAEVTAEWEGLHVAENGLVCEFPTLSQPGPTPTQGTP